MIEIGSRRELFVDHHLIERTKRCRLDLHRPCREGVALRFNRPWEGRHCCYITVIRDGSLYRMYYRGMPTAGGDGSSTEVTAYAESKDGVRWVRPDVGIYRVGGTKKNNAVLAGAPPFTHNFSPFLDTRPGVGSSRRYKALAGLASTGLVTFVSPDGLHWKKLRAKPVFTESAFDSQNLAFWSESEGMYLCYFRTCSTGLFSGYRTISRTTSRDFIHWMPPVAMDFGNTPMEHLYTNATQPYFRAPHLYVALPQRFFTARGALPAELAARLVDNPAYRVNCSDGALMTSRGGNRYDRTFMDSFMPPGPDARDWISRNNMPAVGIVPAGDGRNLYMYRLCHYGQPTCHVARYSLRLDGFISVRAPYSGGQVITKALRFAGSRLTINFATGAPGGVRVEIQNAAGRPIPGFALRDSIEAVGDQIDGKVTWKAGPDVSRITGRPVRIRFVMKDADLYSFRFLDPDRKAP